MYAEKLNDFFKQELKNNKEAPCIFTSTLKRTIQTASKLDLGAEPIKVKVLDEINVGVYDGMTYKEIESQFTEDYNERKQHKLTYRYPRGESYLDLINRIEPVIFEIERCRSPVILIAHQAVIRCLFAYFSQQEIPTIPNLYIPLHEVIKLTPDAYFCKE